MQAAVIDRPARPAARRAQHRAQTHDAGLSAERSVARHYLRRGYAFRHHRWRGSGGEVDIVFADGDRIIFVEVKKSRDFDRAAQAISPAQIRRIFRTTEEYVGHLPKGQLTDFRIDLALVDEQGAVRVVENAFAWM